MSDKKIKKKKKKLKIKKKDMKRKDLYENGEIIMKLGSTRRGRLNWRLLGILVETLIIVWFYILL